MRRFHHHVPDRWHHLRPLRELGLTPVLLTGDNTAVAWAVAAEFGIDQVTAEVLPADKVDVIKRLHAAGHGHHSGTW